MAIHNGAQLKMHNPLRCNWIPRPGVYSQIYRKVISHGINVIIMYLLTQILSLSLVRLPRPSVVGGFYKPNPLLVFLVLDLKKKKKKGFQLMNTLSKSCQGLVTYNASFFFFFD